MEDDSVIVTTFSGSGSSGSTDGEASVAQFNCPHSIVRTFDGNFFIVDYYNHNVRKIDQFGHVTTFAGNGNKGLQNGSLESAEFNCPRGVTCDTSGNIFVADYYNNLIRRISTLDLVVESFAGSGSAGSIDGKASLAAFDGPHHLTFDPRSNHLYIADNNNQIRYVSLEDGMVRTLAGAKYSGYKVRI